MCRFQNEETYDISFLFETTSTRSWTIQPETRNGECNGNNVIDVANLKPQTIISPSETQPAEYHQRCYPQQWRCWSGAPASLLTLETPRVLYRPINYPPNPVYQVSNPICTWSSFSSTNFTFLTCCNSQNWIIEYKWVTSIDLFTCLIGYFDSIELEFSLRQFWIWRK